MRSPTVLPPGQARSLALCASILLLSACGAAPVVDEPPPKPGFGTLVGRPIDLSRSPVLDEIARLEEARSNPHGRLVALADDSDGNVRRRAVQALGRLPWPEFGEDITRALVARMEDPACREDAAFALGMRGDPVAAGTLAAYLNDPDPALRARVVEAASRIGDPSLHATVLIALRDSDLGVRIEAALATARWSLEEAGAEDVDRALLDALRPYRIAPEASPRTRPERTARTAVEAELVWRILYALSRRKSALGRGAFLEYGGSDVPLERLFAVVGLGRIPADPEVVAAAAAALTSEDWRVAYEATVALGELKAPSALEALAAAVDHRVPHVRAGALAAISKVAAKSGNAQENPPKVGARSEKALPPIQRGLADLSPVVRNAALAAFVQIAPVEDALAMLDKLAASQDAIVRLGVARAAAHVIAPRAFELLRVLAADPSLLVATEAVRSLGAHLVGPGATGATGASGTSGEVRVVLHELLSHADNGVRAAAIEALGAAPDPSDLAFLVRAFESSTGDVSEDVAAAVLAHLGRIEAATGAQDFVRRALVDRRPAVRWAAQEVLRDAFHVELGVTQVPPDPARPRVPLAGQDYPAWTTNPMVEVKTSRGSMVFELFPAEAPKHVFNFVELAERGEYDGTLFHRVVPDFVIQGGDYRGDGNGGRPALGQALRHEFGRRKHVRGSLAMPRNSFVDSGGSQLYVTHRPTPHLDGRYTVFGELRWGGDVLDAIEVGDRILGVRLLP